MYKRGSILNPSEVVEKRKRKCVNVIRILNKKNNCEIWKI